MKTDFQSLLCNYHIAYVMFTENLCPFLSRMTPTLCLLQLQYLLGHVIFRRDVAPEMKLKSFMYFKPKLEIDSVLLI